jgi:hypothetical protein
MLFRRVLANESESVVLQLNTLDAEEGRHSTTAGLENCYLDKTETRIITKCTNYDNKENILCGGSK